MNLIYMGAEVLANRPEFLGVRSNDIGSTIKLGIGVLGAITGAVTLVFKSFRQVGEGYVAIRTFNGRALDKDNEPLHRLLIPGGNWMLPFIHEVAEVNIQGRSTLVETTVDVATDKGFVQYKLGAVASWGVLADRTSGRPDVGFSDAYKFFYCIDTIEDLETKVAAVGTGYLLECVKELEPEDRNASMLTDYAVANLGEIDKLDQYGVGIYDIEVTEFSRAGVIQLGEIPPGLTVVQS